MEEGGGGRGARGVGGVGGGWRTTPSADWT